MNNISENIEAVFFKLGTRNVCYPTIRMLSGRISNKPKKKNKVYKIFNSTTTTTTTILYLPTRHLGAQALVKMCA